jgi:hypothetical protein
VVGSTLATTVGVIPLIAVQGAIHIVAGPLVLARLRRVARRQAAVSVATAADRP